MEHKALYLYIFILIIKIQKILILLDLIEQNKLDFFLI